MNKNTRYLFIVALISWGVLAQNMRVVRGLEKLRLGRYKEAVADFDKAIELNHNLKKMLNQN